MGTLDAASHHCAAEGAMQQQHSTLVLTTLPAWVPRYQARSSRQRPAAALWKGHARFQTSLPALLLLLLACLGLHGECRRRSGTPGDCAAGLSILLQHTATTAGALSDGAVGSACSWLALYHTLHLHLLLLCGPQVLLHKATVLYQTHAIQPRSSVTLSLASAGECTSEHGGPNCLHTEGTNCSACLQGGPGRVQEGTFCLTAHLPAIRSESAC